MSETGPDPFASGAEPVDDPFAAAPEPEVSVEQPPAEAPAPPVVNREGEAVAAEPTFDPASQSLSGPLETQPEDHAPDPVTPQPPPVPDQAPQQSAMAPEPQEPAPAPAEAQEPPQAPQEAAPAPAPAPTPPAPAPAPPEPAPAPQTQAAPAPAANNGDGGGDAPKKPKQTRHYVVLMQTGPNAWSKLDLTGKDYTVEIEEEDGKKARYLEARNNDHAYKLAYHLVGSPRDGATLLPLPKASWRPRRVAPAPPAPERERLVIE